MPEAVSAAPDPGKDQEGPAQTFDEEVLSEIEGRLEREEDLAAIPEGAGQKVELDRADLPLDLDLDEEEEPQAPPAVEVDLAEPEEDLVLETEGGEEGEPEGKRKQILLGSILLGVALLAGGGYFAWKKLHKPPQAKPADHDPRIFTAPMPDPIKTLRMDLEPFLVPLAKSPEGRLLLLKVSLEVADPNDKELLAEKTKLLRDTIYRLARYRLARELKTVRGKMLLRAQMKAEINRVLGRDLVAQVYFSEFVITG